MGICESEANNPEKENLSKKNRLQPFHAPIRSQKIFQNLPKNNGPNILSQTDIISHKEHLETKPIIYKYKSTYGQNNEQITLVTESLYNSLTNIKKGNSKDNINSIDETLNESSSQVYEIIADGKMDEDKVKQSTDETTIDNYIEYIGNRNDDIKKNRIDIYNNKKIKEKNNYINKDWELYI